jgi:hypothetical protein
MATLLKCEQVLEKLEFHGSSSRTVSIYKYNIYIYNKELYSTITLQIFGRYKEAWNINSPPKKFHFQYATKTSRNNIPFYTLHKFLTV